MRENNIRYIFQALLAALFFGASAPNKETDETAGKSHSHEHEHSRTEHQHGHMPDIHHRHGHEDEK